MLCRGFFVFLQREKAVVVRNFRHPATGNLSAGGVSCAVYLHGWLGAAKGGAGQCGLLVVGPVDQRFPYRDNRFCGRLCVLLPMCGGGQAYRAAGFCVEEVQTADNPLFCVRDSLLCAVLLQA